MWAYFLGFGSEWAASTSGSPMESSGLPLIMPKIVIVYRFNVCFIIAVADVAGAIFR